MTNELAGLREALELREAARTALADAQARLAEAGEAHRLAETQEEVAETATAVVEALVAVQMAQNEFARAARRVRLFQIEA